MQKIEEYLRHAAECRNIARTARPAHRHQLEKMAETWEQFAEFRKRQLLKRGAEEGVAGSFDWLQRPNS